MKIDGGDERSRIEGGKNMQRICIALQSEELQY